MVETIKQWLGRGCTPDRSVAALPFNRVFVRHCPICGQHTRQRLMEAGSGYLTYWCTECAIPHDAERPAAAHDLHAGRH